MKLMIEVSDDLFEFIKNTSITPSTKVLFGESSKDREGTLAINEAINAIKSGKHIEEIDNPCIECANNYCAAYLEDRTCECQKYICVKEE